MPRAVEFRQEAGSASNVVEHRVIFTRGATNSTKWSVRMANRQTPNCPAAGSNNLLDHLKVNTQEFNYFNGAVRMRPLFVKRARVAGNRQQPFEAVNALVYLWIPFNAWLAQTVVDDTKSENDSYLVAAAGCDARLSGHFDGLLAERCQFQGNRRKVPEFWPIFKVRWLIENGVRPWGVQEDDRRQRLERAAYRDLCFSKNPEPTRYRPQCYMEHQEPIYHYNWK